MLGWSDCKKCSGKGFQLIPGGWKSCHDDPTDEPYAVLGQTVVTKSDAEKMVGG